MSKKNRTVNPAIYEGLKSVIGQPVDKIISYEAAVDDFIQYSAIKGLSKHTASSYAKELNQLQKSFVEQGVDLTDIREVKAPDFEEFIRLQVAKGYAPSTINIRVRTARIFGNYCVKKGYTSNNAASEVSLLKMRHTVGATFTQAQLKRLLETPDISTFEGVRDLAIMLTFADTGIRLSELEAIRTADVVFPDRAINIQRTKNGYARRIPMTKRLQAVLRAYMKVRGLDEFTSALFITIGDKPLNARSIQYQIREHGRRSGVLDDVQCSPHVFRRTFAKFKIKAGVDIFTLQQLMGHSDITELRKYVAIYSADLDDAIEKGIK